VFDYLDFRAYLRDYYEAKKAEGRGFSYRAFSRQAQLRSPNHLKRVTDGERNLTPSMATRYADTLGLAGDDARYFVDLVAFNQSKTSRERDAAYQRLTGFRGYRKAHKLDLAHAAYYSTWYLPAIREMASRADFRADPAWIARRLRPPIAVSEAARALDTLVELGLLVEKKGRVVQGEAVLTTGPETRGHHIRTYHETMMGRAAASMDLVPAAQRDISSLTMCVGEDGLRKIKDRIQRFRQELISIATEEDEPDQVIQLNMHLFPLTTRRADEEDA
jgi:uncharacterized protein (TIGR02147 family)